MVVTNGPSEYLVMGSSHCGAYSVKGILSAYGLDSKELPEEYHTNLVSRLTGVGFLKNYYVSVLKRHGLEAEGKNASGLSDKEKLELLKGLISRNIPAMIVISNGYTREGEYLTWRAGVFSHWITLWGYDDKERMFYVYDSYTSPQFYSKNMQVGNVKRTYDEILRDWRGALSTRVLLGWGDYYYIEIKTPVKLP